MKISNFISICNLMRWVFTLPLLWVWNLFIIFCWLLEFSVFYFPILFTLFEVVFPFVVNFYLNRKSPLSVFLWILNLVSWYWLKITKQVSKSLWKCFLKCVIESLKLIYDFPPLVCLILYQWNCWDKSLKWNGHYYFLSALGGILRHKLFW